MYNAKQHAGIGEVKERAGTYLLENNYGIVVFKIFQIAGLIGKQYH